MDEINQGMINQAKFVMFYLLAVLLGTTIVVLPYVVLLVLGIWILGISYFCVGMIIYMAVIIIIPLYRRSKAMKQIRTAIDNQNIKFGNRGINFRLSGFLPIHYGRHFTSCSLEIELGPVAV